MMFKPTL